MSLDYTSSFVLDTIREARRMIEFDANTRWRESRINTRVRVRSQAAESAPRILRRYNPTDHRPRLGYEES